MRQPQPSMKLYHTGKFPCIILLKLLAFELKNSVVSFNLLIVKR